MTIRRSQIKSKKIQKLGLSIVPIYKVNESESETLVKEHYFIKNFKTYLNNLTLK